MIFLIGYADLCQFSAENFRRQVKAAQDLQSHDKIKVNKYFYYLFASIFV